MMLVELAVADAYGLGFEFADENLPKNTLEGYVYRPFMKRKHWPEGAGVYSDDTQMSIAIAELLVEVHRYQKEWTPLEIANKFVYCFKRDPIEGYARRFYDFLRETPDGETFLKNIKPSSERSGAAMRACPLGVMNDKNKVLEYAEIQAKVTHDTPNGIYAAQAATLMTHYFLHVSHDPAYLPVYIHQNVPHGEEYDWLTVWDKPVGHPGWQSVLAALTAVSQNDNLADCLKACIAFSGDVDTVATIAMAAASCSLGYKQNLPQVLYDNLRNDKYGKDYIAALNEKLFLDCMQLKK